MKRSTLLLLFFAVLLLLGGCSSMDPYYTRGWLNPKSLDEPEVPPSAPPPMPSGLSSEY